MTTGVAATTRIVVAGTAGGVGTTTVTALLFEAIRNDSAGAPQLLDHTGGELGLRLAEGDEVVELRPDLALLDLGPHALTEAVDRLDDRNAFLVAVTAATPAGAALADDLLDRVAERHGTAQLRRVVVACVGVFGRHRIGPAIQGLRGRVGTRSVVLIPQDLSLAAGGRIPSIRLTTATRRAERQLSAVLRERLTRRIDGN